MTNLRKHRAKALAARRDLKMAKSVHAYVRGITANFYKWLATSPMYPDIPVGPPVWICGDCHLGNLGPLADADGRVDIQIRDLDQTIIGNPAPDLIRLALSLEAAARSSDLPGITTARMMEAMIDGYARALTVDETDDPPEPDVIKAAQHLADGRSWCHLAKERINGVEPTIPVGKRFWKLLREKREAIHVLFQDPAILEQIRRLADVKKTARIRVVDAAYWRKGCSSLGNARYAVLLGVTGRKSR